MSYSQVNTADTDYSVPTLTRSYDMEATVRSHYRADTGALETTILLPAAIAKVAGFRAGSRVTVLRGTGTDKGKVRIVANKHGTLRFSRTSPGTKNKLRLRTTRLLNRPSRTHSAVVTSYAKGAVTLSL